MQSRESDMSDYLDRIFGAGGLLAERFDGYEPRPMQVDMAKAIERAFDAQENLIVEAPCGVGKSFAYLAPAVRKARESRRQVIVATANIALQEQLASKDLPFLQDLLADDCPFTYALLKGKGNYLCKRRLAEFIAKVESGRVNLNPWKRKQLSDIERWAEETDTGDKSELAFHPDDDVWRGVCGDTEECVGDVCGEDCFFSHARTRAWEADVVVTNYHLLFSHISLLATAGRHCIFPDLPFLICDEGHELPDIARSFLGWRVTDFGVRLIVNMLEREGDRLVGDEDTEDRGKFLLQLGSTIDSEARKVFTRLDDLRTDPEKLHYDGCRLRRPGLFDPGALLESLLAAHPQVVRLEAEAEGPKTKAMFTRIATAITNLSNRLADAYHLAGDPHFVYWLEENRGRRGGTVLCAKPVDVAPHLNHFLFRDVPQEELEKGTLPTPISVIVTSATLSTGGNFDFISRELGYEGGGAMELPSPFDFTQQALFVCPEMYNQPNARDFPNEVAFHVNGVIDVAEGRTLGLFTSYRNLNAMRGKIESNGKSILFQGDGPRTRLVNQFREELSTSLLGTMSMWTGVDVQGESLTALVIDKLPFPSPSDPVMDALKEIRSNSFISDFIPRATMIFKQGFGRLIRSRRDYGVVVVLDRRLFDKSYGGLIMRSLPPCRRTRDVSEVRPFLRAHREGR